MTVQDKVAEMYGGGVITKSQFDTFEKCAGSDIKNRDISTIEKSAAGSAGIKSFFKNWGPAIGLGAMGVSAAAGVGEKVVGAIKLNKDQKNAYTNMFKKVPQLREYSKQDVDDYYGVVKQYAPEMAANPLVAGNLVNKMIQFGGVDSALIGELTKATKNLASGPSGAGEHFQTGIAKTVALATG